MKARLLNWLVCPACQKPLTIHTDAQQGDEIVSGKLHCAACGQKYPIIRGIPRFVPTQDYTSSFGHQWNQHREVQLDSRNGTDFSRQRFYSITEWKPENLNGKLVLDVGCGAGRFAEVALSDGAEVVAVDLSDAVEASYANLSAHPKFHVVQASIFSLPIPKGLFDKAYCIGVIQHTPDPQKAVACILPKVKTGGEAGFWIYEFCWKNYFGTLAFKYLLRPWTRNWSIARVERFATSLEKFFWPVVRWGVRSGLPGKVVMRCLPVSCSHLHGVPLSESHLREWVRLDTFDMYSPAHDHPQRFSTVANWIENAGFKVHPSHPHGGISITATRLP